METKIEVAKQINAKTNLLTVSQTEELAGILEKFEFDKGKYFLQEGQICNHICYVHSGLVRQFYYKNGKELTEHFTCENGMFWCIESYIKQIPSRLIVETLEASVIYGIPYKPLRRLMESNRSYESFYLKLVETSLILSQEKADSWRFETAQERYIRLLKTQPEVIKRAPLSHVASYLLMTPETLSRVRANIL